MFAEYGSELRAEWVGIGMRSFVFSCVGACKLGSFRLGVWFRGLGLWVSVGRWIGSTALTLQGKEALNLRP